MPASYKLAPQRPWKVIWRIAKTILGLPVDDEIIYLDNNATTQLDPEVIEEMLPFLTKYYGNPSSGYAFAAKARKAVDLARERLAALLG
jgi:selenocysteine lyase/cysteine desulfurase